MIIFDIFFHNSKYIKLLDTKNLKNISNISYNNFLFDNTNGDSAARGTATRKVFIMKAKPIQRPKSKI